MASEDKKATGTCTRREAIKYMGYAVAGIAVGPSLMTSCKGGSNRKETGNTVSPRMSAPEGSRIVSRRWDALDETVGLLGLGCMRLPSLPGDNPWGGPLDQVRINEMVDYSLEHGINYFDTAPAYGESEKAMGVALSRYPRESYLLATKMSNFAFGPNKPTREAAERMFATSMANLQTDYFDFFLLHALGSQSDFENRYINNGVLDFLKQMKAEGKIHHLGFSFHGTNEEFVKLIDSADWDFVQIQMNYVDWKDMPLGPGPADVSKCDSETLYDTLVSRGIPVAVMEPVRGGALANVSEALRERLAERHPELTPAGTALTFVGSFPGVMVTLSGMSNMEQLRENVATFTDFKPFNEKDNEFLIGIAELYNANTHIPCTSCSYCMPCPNGVNIPGNFRIFNAASDELRVPNPDGEKDMTYRKNRKAFLADYVADLSVTERADACTKCNVCIEKCPQHIRIPQQLQAIKDLVAKLG